MQALIAFDISDDQRRYRLTRVLLDYGQRIQESVFWIDCEDDLMDRIRERVKRTVDAQIDNLWIVPVCGACTKRIETMGIGRKPEVPAYFIF